MSEEKSCDEEKQTKSNLKYGTLNECHSDSNSKLDTPSESQNSESNSKRLNLSEEQQTQNTFLRERFLRMLTSISDHSVDFTLTNGSRMAARFVGSDVDVLHFQVSALETPIGVQPHAILRATDCTCFNVHDMN